MCFGTPGKFIQTYTDYCFVFILFVSGEFKLRLMETIKTPADLLNHLETRGFIDRNNLLYLQAILYHIDKPDLFDMVVEYAASTLDDVVHFQKPSANLGRRL